MRGNELHTRGFSVQMQSGCQGCMPKVHLQCSLFVVHCYPLHHDVNPSPKLVDRKNPLFQLPAVHVVEVVVCLFF